MKKLEITFPYKMSEGNYRDIEVISNGSTLDTEYALWLTKGYINDVEVGFYPTNVGVCFYEDDAFGECVRIYLNGDDNYGLTVIASTYPVPQVEMAGKWYKVYDMGGNFPRALVADFIEEEGLQTLPLAFKTQESEYGTKVSAILCGVEFLICTMHTNELIPVKYHWEGNTCVAKIEGISEKGTMRWNDNSDPRYEGQWCKEQAKKELLAKLA